MENNNTSIYEWIPCHLDASGMSLVPDLEDGKWYEWLSKDGRIQEARYKRDAFDHFWPRPPLFPLSEAVAYRYIENYEYGYAALGNLKE